MLSWSVLIGHIRRSSEVTWSALVLFVIAALATIPTYTTGKGSGRVIRGLPGVIREFTIEHSQSAQFALIACLLLGAVSIWGLWQMRNAGDTSGGIRWAVWILAIFTTAIMFRTADLGGKIRHTETRPDYVLPTADPNAGPGEPGGPGGGAPGGSAPGTQGGSGTPAP